MGRGKVETPILPPRVTIEATKGRGVERVLVEFDRGNQDAGLRLLSRALPGIEALHRLIGDTHVEPGLVWKPSPKPEPNGRG